MKRKIVALGLLLTMLVSMFTNTNWVLHATTTTGNADGSVHLRVHYHRFDGNYEGWNFWVWPEGKEGAAYVPTGTDDFGAVADVKIPDAAVVAKLGIIARLNEWEAKDGDSDRFIPMTQMGDDGVLDVYLVQSDTELYYDASEVDLSPAFLSADLSEMDRIDIAVTVPFTLKDSKTSFTLTADDGSIIPVKHVTVAQPQDQVSVATVILESPMVIGKQYTLAKEGYGEILVGTLNLFSTKEFEENYTYTGDDLGAVYAKDQTTFKVWAPTAKKVKVLLYKEGNGGNAYEQIEMKGSEKGTWVVSVTGDLNHVYYTYQVAVGNQVNEAVDPYAKATGVNGDRGMVIDLSSTNPTTWAADKRPEFKNFTDAIVYELHVRDLSTSDSSGIQNKGKFLGVVEQNTKNVAGQSTGLAHLKELGITHLQLLPVFDYRTIDETKLTENNFNWGYDPENYNVPEGSYSTDPYHGEVRIHEFKQMVQGIHQADIRLIMDVVYNHTGASEDSNLNKIVPGYYYRTVKGVLANGSGCGNETASERSMVRKMIVDSVTYWAREYHVDGFRFDLMGLHDMETMKEVRAALDKIDPTIIVYGEGWTGGTSPLPDVQKSLKKNIYTVSGIGAFSDDIRDGIKGSVFEDTQPGFVNGGNDLEESIKFGIIGATQNKQVVYSKVNYSEYPWTEAPGQSINYAEAHDNMTLWDKLLQTNPKDSEADRTKMDQLAASIFMTAQGIPFIHAGMEMLRTKDGDENSYKSSDAINQIDWSRKTTNEETYKYYQGLIALRKAHPAFRMNTTEEINKNLIFFGKGADYGDLQLEEKNMVAYIISNNANQDSSGTICVVFNANREVKSITIPEGNWEVVVKGAKAGTEVIEAIKGGIVSVEPLSTLVLTRQEAIDLSTLTGESAKQTDTSAVSNRAETEPLTSTTKPVWPWVIGGLALLGLGVGVFLKVRKKNKPS